MTTKKRVLIINRRPPCGHSSARDALDVALTCGVFELEVSLLFVDDGVLQLINHQQPQAIGQKSLSAVLSALPMYDIEQIYACSSSLSRYGLAPSSLVNNPLPADDALIQQLIREHDLVLNF